MQNNPSNISQYTPRDISQCVSVNALLGLQSQVCLMCKAKNYFGLTSDVVQIIDAKTLSHYRNKSCLDYKDKNRFSCKSKNHLSYKGKSHLAYKSTAQDNNDIYYSRFEASICVLLITGTLTQALSGGEGNCHSNVAAPCPHGLLPTFTRRCNVSQIP